MENFKGSLQYHINRNTSVEYRTIKLIVDDSMNGIFLYQGEDFDSPDTKILWVEGLETPLYIGYEKIPYGFNFNHESEEIEEHLGSERFINVLNYFHVNYHKVLKEYIDDNFNQVVMGI